MVAVAFVAPLFTVQSTTAEADPARERVAFGIDLPVGAMADDPRSILGDLPTETIDDPGAPWGFPNDNTLGYTTKGSTLDVWRWDYQGAFDIDVDMGKLAKKKDISGEEDYILEMYFGLVGWFWNDGDGVYDPAPGVSPGYGGDDPCPQEPFKLFTVFVNGQEIRTLEGHNTQPCAPGGPEVSRTFEIVPVGGDLPNQVRVPKNIVTEGVNKVRIRVEDFVTGPPNNPYHTETNDGFEIYMQAVAIELAAPPLVLSHGWTPDFDPATATVPWQPIFKANIKSEFTAHTGQNPWRWAQMAGKDAILLNFYDKKGDIRVSARELRSNVQNFHGDLGFSGKGWMHGHSMGGLVSRYYLEVLGGNSKIDRFAQTGTPNLGSWEAGPYTYAYWMNYEQWNEEYTAKWFWIAPGWPFDCCVKVWRGWHDWWNPGVGAFQYYDGPGHGRDHLADFILKAPDANPILANLNTRFPASGVSYFSVRGDCNVWTRASCLLSNPLWRGDGAVGLDSATLNGAIMHRTIDMAHEEIPEQIHTARWMIRFWGGLNLDTGRPLAVGAQMGEEYPRPLTEDELREKPLSQVSGSELLILPTDVATSAYEYEVNVDAGAPRADFVLFAAPSEDPIDITIRTPGGTVYTPTSTEVTYSEVTGATLRVQQYTVLAPASGTWTLLIEPADVPPTEGIPVYVGAYLPGAAVQMSARTNALRHTPSDPATILATLTNNGAPLTGATVTARTLDEVGAPIEVALLDDGAHNDGAANDGVYGAPVEAGATDGSTRYDVRATGAGFERSATVEIVVARTTDLRVASLTGSPAGAWGGDAVTLTANIVSEGERGVAGGATAHFYDGNPAAGGVLLGSVDITSGLDVGQTAVASLDTLAPTHALNLFVAVDSIDLEDDIADNVASALMPFVAAPKTVASVEDAWYLEAVDVTLAPFDGSAQTGTTRYRLDGGDETIYAGGFTFDTEGEHTLEYWTTSPGGAVEPTRSVTFGVDLAAPTGLLRNPLPAHAHTAGVRVQNPQGTTLVIGLVDVAVEAADTGAGVARVALRLDGEPAGATTEAGKDGLWHVLWDTSAASTGDHTLVWEVTDGAGRTTSGSMRLYVVAARGVEVEKDPFVLLNRLIPGGA